MKIGRGSWAEAPAVFAQFCFAPVPLTVKVDTLIKTSIYLLEALLECHGECH